MDQTYARQFFTPEAAEETYARLARKLYPLCTTEEGLASQEADDLREAMELPWYALSDDGQARMHALCLALAKEFP